ncbi:MAG TPA: potassium transporter Kup [Deltaproteobacteria bacterium]|nr:potassium transporter Kup [Deltaproteobacteria bacterium]
MDSEKAKTRENPTLALLTVATLGVVFGDIGTSPLYAFRQCFRQEAGQPIVEADVLGILSLITWALLLVVSLKYLVFILRADNRGEGGILALLALGTKLAHRESFHGVGRLSVVIGLFGAALLYGDGVITPAISVLAAVEGLQVITPRFEPYVLPLTVSILIGLFAVQRFGTQRISSVFGPTMFVWFLLLGVLGVSALQAQPGVLAALNPVYAMSFILRQGSDAFPILGAVVLSVTGCEALYADMGHFGVKSIRMAWYGMVLPALLLNYFGQGAHLLATGHMTNQPFFEMAPSWGLYPLIGMATVATIIASQALITGAFSVTKQAIQLGFLPRMQIVHTSGSQQGQVYLPGLNRSLMVLSILIVLGFRNSASLADAYGVAVSGTMLITSILFFQVARQRWRWNLIGTLALTAVFLCIDLTFLTANLTKIPTGGWLPLVLALLGLLLMMTWRRGLFLLLRSLDQRNEDTESFFARIQDQEILRTPGTAIYLTGETRGVPVTLLRNLRANQALHERVILLSLLPIDTSRVDDEERVTVTEMTQGFTRVVALFGFMEQPDPQRALTAGSARDLKIDVDTVFYFQNAFRIAAFGRGGMARWRMRIFAALVKNSFPAVGYLELPMDRSFEITLPVEL